MSHSVTYAVGREKVREYAYAVGESDPRCLDPEAARAAGFDGVPVPPTYFFSAAGHWGAFPEAQPADAQPDSNPTMEIIGQLMANGGMVLHGEQEFTYHRPVVVGETLRSEGKVADLYEKAAGERTMTFLVTETEYRDTEGELVLTARMNLIHRS